MSSISTREIIYTVGGKEFTGFLAVADNADGKRPGVLVVHEWWGHNEHSRKAAIALAEAGYAGFALDMYGTGILAESPDNAQQFMESVIGEEGAIPARFDGAVSALIEQPEVDGDQLAAIGYCFGGAVVLNMARAGKALKAVASFHGLLNTEVPMSKGAFAGKIDVYTGADDPMVGSDVEKAFAEEMSAAGADYSLKSYPGVLHGFTNPAATERGQKYGMPLAYDETATQDSWSGTLETLKAAFA